MEIMGSGMVHPSVLEAAGIDSERYTGWAFGMGPGRIALLRYGLPDIRLLYDPMFASSSRWRNERVRLLAQRLHRTRRSRLSSCAISSRRTQRPVEEMIALRDDLKNIVIGKVIEKHRIPTPTISTSRRWTWVRASCSTSCAAHPT